MVKGQQMNLMDMVTDMSLAFYGILSLGLYVALALVIIFDVANPHRLEMMDIVHDKKQ